MKKKKKRAQCCFCGRFCRGDGNSPAPIDDDPDARCCDNCYHKIVKPFKNRYYNDEHKETPNEQSK